VAAARITLRILAAILFDVPQTSVQDFFHPMKLRAPQIAHIVEPAIHRGESRIHMSQKKRD
jgi:hypothetical protein